MTSRPIDPKLIVTTDVIPGYEILAGVKPARSGFTPHSPSAASETASGR